MCSTRNLLSYIASFQAVFLILIACVGATVTPTSISPQQVADTLFTSSKIEYLREKTLVNVDEIALSVGFSNRTANPYPRGNTPYNVDIPDTQQCYLRFLDQMEDTYELLTVDTALGESFDAGYGMYLTHHGPCGVCSSLQDLAVYAEKRDLTNPVRRCGVIPFLKTRQKCIKKLGFSDSCSWIWTWNTVNTARSERKGGCFKTCVKRFLSNNLSPAGTLNPCQPLDGRDESSEVAMKKFRTSQNTNRLHSTSTINPNDLPTIAAPPHLSASKSTATFHSRKNGEKKTGCRNTINNGPACSEWQYQNGPFRLNACLQCDECQSGPLFKKVAGRTRRNSGIKSGIARPDVKSVDHTYGMRSQTQLPDSHQDYESNYKQEVEGSHDTVTKMVSL